MTRRATVRSERGLLLRGTVTDPAATVATGDSVTVATRPERLEVRVGDDLAAEAAPGWTALAGRIHQGTYLGDHSEYRVVTDGAGELIVRRQNTVGAGSALGEDPATRWSSAGTRRPTSSSPDELAGRGRHPTTWRRSTRG